MTREPRGSHEWPIVERGTLVADVVAGLTHSPARGAYLAGPAGAGKTVLAGQAAARLEDREAVTVVGMAELGSVPLGAWAPVLAARGLPADPEGAFAAIMAQLGARPHGVVLVVDDAPRLDDMSAAVVYQLVRGFGLPVVATARLGENPPAPIQRLLDEGLVEPVPVGGLDEAEVARVLELRFGQLARHGDVVRLRARTEGNPLYIRALVEQAARSGGTRVEQGAVTIADGRTPPALLDVVAQRLDSLPQAAREALHLIAVAQPLRPEQLASGAIEPAVLDDLERAGLVVFHADAGASVAHPLIAEALARAADAAEVRRRAIGLLRAGRRALQHAGSSARPARLTPPRPHGLPSMPTPRATRQPQPSRRPR